MLMDEADFEQDELEKEEEPEEEEELEDQQQENGVGNLLNVGTVRIREEPLADPVLLQRLSHHNQENFSLTFTENIPRKIVKVAAQWAPFFASLLLSPRNFKWAKNFIESEAWAFLNSSLKTSLIKIPDCSPAVGYHN
jgi:hypothetical protein